MGFKPKLLKFTALITLASFLFSGLSAPGYAADTLGEAPQPAFPNDIQSMRLTPELGEIEETFQGSAAKTVVIIQDAHAIPDAQRKIEQIIEHFQKSYGVDFIGLEGADSQLDPQMFRSFPDQKLLRQVFEEYYERGELTGGTAAAIFFRESGPSSGGPKPVFQGIEDWALYEEGLRLYLAAMKQESELEAKRSEWKADLDQRKKKAYSVKLLEADQKLGAFHSNEMDLLEVLNFLASVKPPDPHTELAVLVEESAKEGKDNASLEMEVKQIAKGVEQYLKSKNSTDPIRLFNEKRQLFHTSRLSPQAFALFLKELIEKEGLEIRVSEELLGGMKNQKMMRDLEGSRFFKDFERYAQSVKESLIQNDNERNLDQETRQFDLMSRLMKLELSREDWLEVKAHSVQRIADRELSDHIAFYKNAESRDARLFEHLMKSMTESALLVAGGFHAQGLVNHLKEKEVSFVLIRPAINSIPNETSYRSQMRGEFSWKSYFEVENGKVNLYKAFVRATRDKLLADSVERIASTEKSTADSSYSLNAKRQTLKNWRDQIIRDLAVAERIENAGDYTKFIDEAAGASVQDPAYQAALEKISRFIEGLRGLEAENKLTEENVIRLIRPATVLPLVEVLAIGDFPADLVGMAKITEPVVSPVAVEEASVQRAEIRSEARIGKEGFEVGDPRQEAPVRGKFLEKGGIEQESVDLTKLNPGDIVVLESAYWWTYVIEIDENNLAKVWLLPNGTGYYRGPIGGKLIKTVLHRNQQIIMPYFTWDVKTGLIMPSELSSAWMSAIKKIIVILGSQNVQKATKFTQVPKEIEDKKPAGESIATDYPKKEFYLVDPSVLPFTARFNSEGDFVLNYVYQGQLKIFTFKKADILTGNNITIGRSSKNLIGGFDIPFLSRYHARISFEVSENQIVAYLENLSSSNRTYILSEQLPIEVEEKEELLRFLLAGRSEARAKAITLSPEDEARWQSLKIGEQGEWIRNHIGGREKPVINLPRLREKPILHWDEIETFTSQDRQELETIARELSLQSGETVTADDVLKRIILRMRELISEAEQAYLASKSQEPAESPFKPRAKGDYMFHIRRMLAGPGVFEKIDGVWHEHQSIMSQIETARSKETKKTATIPMENGRYLVDVSRMAAAEMKGYPDVLLYFLEDDGKTQRTMRINSMSIDLVEMGVFQKEESEDVTLEKHRDQTYPTSPKAFYDRHLLKERPVSIRSEARSILGFLSRNKTKPTEIEQFRDGNISTLETTVGSFSVKAAFTGNFEHMDLSLPEQRGYVLITSGDFKDGYSLMAWNTSGEKETRNSLANAYERVVAALQAKEPVRHSFVERVGFGRSEMRGVDVARLNNYESEVLKIYSIVDSELIDVLNQQSFDFIEFAGGYLKQLNKAITHEVALKLFRQGSPQFNFVSDERIQKLYEFVNQTETNSLASEFAGKMGRILAMREIPEAVKNGVLDNKILPVQEGSDASYIDFASGIYAAVYFKNLRPDREYIFVDNSYFVVGYLEEAKHILKAGQVSIRRQDMMQMMGESRQYGTVRMKNVWPYVPQLNEANDFWNWIQESIEPGGQLIIEVLPEPANREKFLPIWQKYLDPLSQKWNFESQAGEAVPQSLWVMGIVSTPDLLIFTKPRRSEARTSESKFEKFNAAFYSSMIPIYNLLGISLLTLTTIGFHRIQQNQIETTPVLLTGAGSAAAFVLAAFFAELQERKRRVRPATEAAPSQPSSDPSIGSLLDFIDANQNVQTIIETSISLRDQIESNGFAPQHSGYQLLNEIANFSEEFNQGEITQDVLRQKINSKYDDFKSIKSVLEALGRLGKISKSEVGNLIEAFDEFNADYSLRSEARQPEEQVGEAEARRQEAEARIPPQAEQKTALSDAERNFANRVIQWLHAQVSGSASYNFEAKDILTAYNILTKNKGLGHEDALNEMKRSFTNFVVNRTNYSEFLTAGRSLIYQANNFTPSVAPKIERTSSAPQLIEEIPLKGGASKEGLNLVARIWQMADGSFQTEYSHLNERTGERVRIVILEGRRDAHNTVVMYGRSQHEKGGPLVSSAMFITGDPKRFFPATSPYASVVFSKGADPAGYEVVASNREIEKSPIMEVAASSQSVPKTQNVQTAAVPNQKSLPSGAPPPLQDWARSTKIPGQDQAAQFRSEARQSRFRFSMRSLLLATTAVAALASTGVTLYFRNDVSKKIDSGSVKSIDQDPRAMTYAVDEMRARLKVNVSNQNEEGQINSLTTILHLNNLSKERKYELAARALRKEDSVGTVSSTAVNVIGLLLPADGKFDAEDLKAIDVLIEAAKNHSDDATRNLAVGVLEKLPGEALPQVQKALDEIATTSRSEARKFFEREYQDADLKEFMGITYDLLDKIADARFTTILDLLNETNVLVKEYPVLDELFYYVLANQDAEVDEAKLLWIIANTELDKPEFKSQLIEATSQETKVQINEYYRLYHRIASRLLTGQTDGRAEVRVRTSDEQLKEKRDQLKNLGIKFVDPQQLKLEQYPEYKLPKEIRGTAGWLLESYQYPNQMDLGPAEIKLRKVRDEFVIAEKQAPMIRTIETADPSQLEEIAILEGTCSACSVLALKATKWYGSEQHHILMSVHIPPGQEEADAVKEWLNNRLPELTQTKIILLQTNPGLEPWFSTFSEFESKKGVTYLTLPTHVRADDKEDIQSLRDYDLESFSDFAVTTSGVYIRTFNFRKEEDSWTRRMILWDDFEALQRSNPPAGIIEVFEPPADAPLRWTRRSEARTQIEKEFIVSNSENVREFIRFVRDKAGVEAGFMEHMEGSEASGVTLPVYYWDGSEQRHYWNMPLKSFFGEDFTQVTVGIMGILMDYARNIEKTYQVKFERPIKIKVHAISTDKTSDRIDSITITYQSRSEARVVPAVAKEALEASRQALQDLRKDLQNSKNPKYESLATKLASAMNANRKNEHFLDAIENELRAMVPNVELGGNELGQLYEIKVKVDPKTERVPINLNADEELDIASFFGVPISVVIRKPDGSKETRFVRNSAEKIIGGLFQYIAGRTQSESPDNLSAVERDAIEKSRESTRRSEARFGEKLDFAQFDLPQWAQIEDFDDSFPVLDEVEARAFYVMATGDLDAFFNDPRVQQITQKDVSKFFVQFQDASQVKDVLETFDQYRREVLSEWLDVPEADRSAKKPNMRDYIKAFYTLQNKVLYAKGYEPLVDLHQIPRSTEGDVHIYRLPVKDLFRFYLGAQGLYRDGGGVILTATDNYLSAISRDGTIKRRTLFPRSAIVILGIIDSDDPLQQMIHKILNVEAPEATIQRDGDVVLLTDTGSRHGTFVARKLKSARSEARVSLSDLPGSIDDHVRTIAQKISDGVIDVFVNGQRFWKIRVRNGISVTKRSRTDGGFIVNDLIRKQLVGSNDTFEIEATEDNNIAIEEIPNVLQFPSRAETREQTFDSAEAAVDWIVERISQLKNWDYELEPGERYWVTAEKISPQALVLYANPNDISRSATSGVSQMSLRVVLDVNKGLNFSDYYYTYPSYERRGLASLLAAMFSAQFKQKAVMVSDIEDELTLLQLYNQLPDDLKPKDERRFVGQKFSEAERISVRLTELIKERLLKTHRDGFRFTTEQIEQTRIGRIRSYFGDKSEVQVYRENDEIKVLMTTARSEARQNPKLKQIVGALESTGLTASDINGELYLQVLTLRDQMPTIADFKKQARVLNAIKASGGDPYKLSLIQELKAVFEGKAQAERKQHDEVGELKRILDAVKQIVTSKPGERNYEEALIYLLRKRGDAISYLETEIQNQKGNGPIVNRLKGVINAIRSEARDDQEIMQAIEMIVSQKAEPSEFVNASKVLVDYGEVAAKALEEEVRNQRQNAGIVETLERLISRIRTKPPSAETWRLLDLLILVKRHAEAKQSKLDRHSAEYKHYTFMIEKAALHFSRLIYSPENSHSAKNASAFIEAARRVFPSMAQEKMGGYYTDLVEMVQKAGGDKADKMLAALNDYRQNLIANRQEAEPYELEQFKKGERSSVEIAIGKFIVKVKYDTQFTDRLGSVELTRPFIPLISYILRESTLSGLTGNAKEKEAKKRLAEAYEKLKSAVETKIEAREIVDGHDRTLNEIIQDTLDFPLINQKRSPRSEARLDAIKTLTDAVIGKRGLTHAEAREIVGYVRIHGIGGLKEEMVKAVAEEMVASLMSDAVLAKELFPYLVNQNGVVRLELSENELAQFDTVEKRSQLFRVLAKTALGLSILNPDLAIEVAGPEKYKQEFIRTIGVVQKEEFEKAGKKIRPWAIQYDPDPTNLPNVLISEKIDPKVKSFNPKSDANDQVIELSEKSIGASLLTGVLLLSKVPDEGVKKMEGREEYRWKNEYSIGIFAALGAFINAAAIKAIERAA